MTFIADLRTTMRVCESMYILPIYTIHAVTILTTIYHDIHVENHSSANRLHFMRVCECVCILPIYIYDPRSDRSEHIYHEIHGKNHSSAHSRTIFHGRIKIITTKALGEITFCKFPGFYRRKIKFIIHVIQVFVKSYTFV